MPNELMLIRDLFQGKLKEIFPQGSDKQHKNTITSIQNAWEKAIFLDTATGKIYVNAEYIHTLLRINSKADAQFLLQNIPSKSKLERGQITYIAVSEIIKIMEDRIQTKSSKTRDYLIYSQELYQVIRDSPTLQLLQQERLEAKKQIIKVLKKKRIQLLKLNKDELTGLQLNIKTAEFAHIRSQNMYEEYAVNMYNGLIVNKETHEIITQNSIHNEIQLLNLCLQEKWNIDWYKDFIKYIQ